MSGSSLSSYRVQTLATVVSAVFNPLILPVAVFGVASVKLESTTSGFLMVNAVGLVFFVFIPFFILVGMKRAKSVDSMDVTVREDRHRPFMYGLLSMGAGLVCFQYLPMQNGLIYIILCMISINNTTVAAIINLKWKISVHAMALSTTATVLYFLSGPFVLQWPGSSTSSMILLLVLFTIVMIVQWSRIKLQMHTPSQVVAGTLLAIILTAIQLTLLVPVSETLTKV
jgi:membrane-associated phospholipid phosphatase